MLTSYLREIFLYESFDHKCPVEEFIETLTIKQAQKIIWVMRLIKTSDIVPDKYLKKLVSTDGIWEIRIKFDSDNFRILGFFDSLNFIATNGFCKKSQKTPPNEIILAQNRKREYFLRKNINYENFRTIH